MESELEQCICDSSSFHEFFKKYFNWLVQVVSVRSVVTANVLRVWDGRPHTFNDRTSGILLSNEGKLVVAEEAYFSEVPRSYFFDILLFGEWVERAASLKSGSIVILKNLHSFVSKSHTQPILAMHEGTGLRRDIVEVDMDKFGNHYRCLKLTNDINKVVSEFCSLKSNVADEAEQPSFFNESQSQADDPGPSEEEEDRIPPDRLEALTLAFALPTNPALMVSTLR
ncbi:hypothetical protein Q1695_015325 [Nippostrongylus brasiliensis]|nr:hypothetical protein Q1695_015325 [Nippostrongylus brasiliensis]